ncbi:hypothetical protein K1719_017110 [Acacia pycnantha]|nr:hypothetical protein K1719_017110 [Acacia pycnantha]
MAISEAEKNAKVSKIFMEQTLLENEGSSRQQEIENQMYLQQERETKEAEANRLKLTREYLELKYIEALGEIAYRTSGNNVFLSWLLHCLQLLARFVFGLAQNMII